MRITPCRTGRWTRSVSTFPTARSTGAGVAIALYFLAVGIALAAVRTRTLGR